MNRMIPPVKIVPVILCGGSGTRLWPASREAYPKQFLNLMGDLSLLQQTMERSLKAIETAATDIVIVTLDAMKPQVISHAAGITMAATMHILSEPSARNTAAAVAFAAEYVASTFGKDALMWVLPADHHMADEAALAAALKNGIAAAQNDYMVTFGIQPTRPETGYGYIRMGSGFTEGFFDHPDFKPEMIFAVKEFVEKPDLETAKTYLASDAYVWNSGMFLFSAGAVLDQFTHYAADILATVKQAMAGGTKDTPAAAIYASIPDHPFDKAIMEKTSKIAVIPCNPLWSDIGSWESLWEIRAKNDNGNVTRGRAVYSDTKNCLVSAHDRLIACAGIQNIVVIETADAVLIADRSNSDAMRALVKNLKAAQAPELRNLPQKKEPSDLGYAAREIRLSANETVSFDPHSASSLFLTPVEGQGYAVIGQVTKLVSAGNSLFIPPQTAYKITASDSALVIVEVRKTASQAEISTQKEKQKAA